MKTLVDFSNLAPALRLRCQRAFEQEAADVRARLPEPPARLRPEPPAPYGSPDYLPNWGRWYGRADVEEAQATARRYLANPDTDPEEAA